MTIKERLAVLETEVKTLKKMISVLILASVGQAGVAFIPW